MTIDVTCQCGQKFGARDDLGGKTIKCPKCGDPLLVPSPPSDAPQQVDPPPSPHATVGSLLDEEGIGVPGSVLASSSSAAAQGGVLCPGCRKMIPHGTVLCVDCGYRLDLGKKVEVKREPERNPYLSPAGGRPSRPRRGKKRKRTSRQPAAFGEFVMTMLTTFAFAVAVPIALAVLGSFAPDLAIAVSLFVFITTYVMLFGVYIWLLVVAFQESVAQAFLVCFVPFYQLYYIVTRWDECQSPVLVLIAGTVMLIGTMIAMSYSLAAAA